MPSSPTGLLSRYFEREREVSGSELPSLRQALSAIPDPRALRGVRYPFTDLFCWSSSPPCSPVRAR